jgi:hypothetical protein
MIMTETILPVGTLVTVGLAGHPDSGKRGSIVALHDVFPELRYVKINGRSEESAWNVSHLWVDEDAYAADPVIPFATGDLHTVAPRSYRVARFPRVSVVTWTARYGTLTVDGVHAVYVNSDANRVTLVRGKYGHPVRFGTETKVVAVISTATGDHADSHPVDDAVALISKTAQRG